MRAVNSGARADAAVRAWAVASPRSEDWPESLLQGALSCIKNCMWAWHATNGGARAEFLRVLRSPWCFAILVCEAISPMQLRILADHGPTTELKAAPIGASNLYLMPGGACWWWASGRGCLLRAKTGLAT